VPEGVTSRNVLTESARIARGDIAPLSELDPQDFDALVLPGGFGAAKSLSDFALNGAECALLEAMQTVIKSFYANSKPIGAMCIAPVLLAVALKGRGLRLTIGDDEGASGIIEALGHHHRNCETEDAVIDDANLIVTCPAYMREDSLANVASGIEKLVQTVLRMINNDLYKKVD
jgi:enhancing lycopene biosynthesis protein 2